MTTHMRWRLGAAALVLSAVALALIVPGASRLCSAALTADKEPGMRPFNGTVLACAEFWLNRYQTLLAAGVAILAASFAWLAAMRQVKAARDQVFHASEQVAQAREQTRQMQAQFPLIQQQAAAVRAEQIGILVDEIDEIVGMIDEVFERLWWGGHALSDVRELCGAKKSNGFSVPVDRLPNLSDYYKRRYIAAISKLADESIKADRTRKRLEEAGNRVRRLEIMKQGDIYIRFLIGALRDLSHANSYIQKCWSIIHGGNLEDPHQLQYLRNFSLTEMRYNRNYNEVTDELRRVLSRLSAGLTDATNKVV